jgi:hypothetical protein
VVRNEYYFECMKREKESRDEREERDLQASVVEHDAARSADGTATEAGEGIYAHPSFPP